jgi:hypothetical protein
MSTPALDPELVKDYRTELAAVHEGHSPLHEELTQNLGQFSLSASKISETQKQIEIDKANYRFLETVVQILPTYDNTQSFRLSGPDAQYVFRQIQANTLWIYPRNHDTPDPFYIIGRADDVNDPESVELLMLSRETKKHPQDSSIGAMIKYVRVRKDDMELRDRLTQNLQDDELNDEVLSSTISRKDGKLELNVETQGSIFLNYDVWGKPSEDKIWKKGVRRRGDSFEEVDYKDSVPGEVMERLHVNTILAKLATAFHVEDQYHAVLEGNFETTDSLDESKFERIIEQNREIKAALKKMMVASGAVDSVGADKLIAERYPNIDL